jgi:putative mRNA 3-end processing factor
LIRDKIAFSSAGILVKHEGKVIALDPERNVSADLTFVSHAHLDHLLRKERNTVLTSRETLEIARARGVSISRYIESYPGLRMVDSGHILGSKALIIGKNEIMYTGDFSQRERGFLKKLEPENVRVLIMESTYGRKEYTFPPTAKVLDHVMRLIGEAYDNGLGVSLHGYTLGKAQLIEYLFQSWRPLVVHANIERINRIYRRFGIRIPEPDKIARSEDDLPDPPYVYVAPMHLNVSRAYYSIRFTGWARSLGLSAVPLSDHADYMELVSFVKKVNPELVILMHGFDREFAEDLREMGFRAYAFSEQQIDLDTYIYV